MVGDEIESETEVCKKRARECVQMFVMYTVAYNDLCTPTHAHAHTHTYTRTPTHARIHSHTHTLTLTHTRTHVFSSKGAVQIP